MKRILLLLGFLLIPTVSMAQGWYNASWSNRFSITSDNTLVDEAVTNLYYDLADAPAGFWSVVQTNCVDVRMTQSDGTTEIAREIVNCDTGANTGHLFLDSGDLATGSDTVYYIYYGNAGAGEPAEDATYGREAVWEASYLGVWHMDDTASPALDSTSNDNDATQTNNPTFSTASKLDDGINFDNTDDMLDIGDAFDLTSASFTFSAWIDPNSIGEGNFGRIFEKGNGLNDWQWTLDNTNQMRFFVSNSATWSNSVITYTGSDQYIAVAYNGANARFYYNGVAAGAPAFIAVPGAQTDTIYIGNRGGADRTWDGEIDELRVSTSVRSANWMSTEYDNMNDSATFWMTGAQEADSGGIAPLAYQIFNRGN